MGILILHFFLSAGQKVIWLGVSGSTLNLMSWACKGYTSTSEIKNFDFRVKPKVIKDDERQSLIPVYVMFYRFIMTLHFLTFQRTESRDQVICLMLDWHKHPEHFCSLSFENVFFR